MEFGIAETPATGGSDQVYSNAVVDFQRQNADTTETSGGPVSRVLVIYTGGTIGMKSLGRNEGYAPAPNWLMQHLRSMPRFNDSNGRETPIPPELASDAEFGSRLRADHNGYEVKSRYDVVRFRNELGGMEQARQPALLTPISLYGKRIRYTILEYTPLLDSANMNMADWVKIAGDIELNYAHYDSFVVLHGTDTMAYTASALSFMLEDLGKTVIITGSQRTDAEENLLGSLLIAGHFVIPEVCIYFGHKLFRGNRCTKIDAMDFGAFDSPNLKPLATVGVNIDINWTAIRRASTIARFCVQRQLNANVAALRLFPGITASTVRAFLSPPIQGVVLETYGAGNAPTARTDILEMLKEASERGVVIINCTQCKRGLVSGLYATGKALLTLGILAGADMTPECALAKLSYLLCKHEGDISCIRQLMVRNLRGELTELQPTLLHGSPRLDFQDLSFMSALAQAMNAQSLNERHRLELALMPHLVCAAAASGSSDAFETLREASLTPNTILNSLDFDGRTALHIACATGNIDIVKRLLLMGASVHLRDSNRWTPLFWACRNRRADIAVLLVSAGANFDREDDDAYIDFFKCVQKGDLSSVKMYVECGIDANATHLNLQTPLHLAYIANQPDVSRYMESLPGIHADAKDAFGKQASEYAELDNS